MEDSSLRKIGKTKLNILSSLALQVVTAVCGLILPRFILLHYGSEANGLIQSVSQILSYTVLLEGGIGGVLRAALYRPLANEDEAAISDIYNQIRSTFRKISIVFILFSFVLALTMKFIVATQFDYWYVLSMVAILSAGTYFSYYLALPQRLLMNADQRLYIIQFCQIGTTLLNLALCLLAIHLGAGIHAVKLVTVCLHMISPICYGVYVKKHYRISRKIHDPNRSLPQKRDGVIHHLAYFIHRNTDVVILSLFSNLQAVSVYSVYSVVINVLEQVLTSISSGISAKVGNLIARAEKDALRKTVDVYAACNTVLSMSFATVTAILILPFVSIYTRGVSDIDYHKPVFAVLMILGGLMYGLRIPYISVVSAAGQYKQTNAGAVGEVVINLGLSLTLVGKYDLAGVAMGTFAAMTFRTVYTVWYLSRNILYRSVSRFIRSTALNLVLSIALVFVFTRWISISADTIFTLIFEAIKVSSVVFTLFGIANAVLEKEFRSWLFSLIHRVYTVDE